MVFREHGSTLVLDIIKLSSGSILPAVNGLQGGVKGIELSTEFSKFVNLVLKSARNLKLFTDSLDLLFNDLLLVFRKSNTHALEVVVDGGEKTSNATIGIVVQVLSFLDLLDFIFCLLKLRCNGLIVLSISNPSILGLLQKLQSVLSLLLGIIPTNLNTLDMSFKELRLVRVLKNLLTFVNKISDNSSLSLKLNQRLFLSLNQLINIFNTGRSNVSGGRHHDTIKELNMGLQLITIGIALPVQVHHNLGLSDGRDELFMLLDEGVQLVRFILLLILGSFSHQDLKDLSQPLLDLSPFQIFAQSVEVISLSLEFGGSIDFVGHDASDGLFDVLHPLGHLLVAHVVDILDEVVVPLPERHLDPELLLPGGIGMSICHGISRTQ